MARSLRLEDFSDRELLAAVADVAADGLVDTKAMAMHIWDVPDTEENADALSHLTRSVSVRFAWLRRFGLMEKGDVIGQWYLSSAGEAMRSGRLPASLRRGIEEAQDSLALVLADQVGRRLYGSGDVAAKAMERELRFHLIRRKRR